jgi:hypothetical protein
MAGNPLRQAVVPTAEFLKNDRRERLMFMPWILVENWQVPINSGYRTSSEILGIPLIFDGLHANLGSDSGRRSDCLAIYGTE